MKTKYLTFHSYSSSSRFFHISTTFLAVFPHSDRAQWSRSDHDQIVRPHTFRVLLISTPKTLLSSADQPTNQTNQPQSFTSYPITTPFRPASIAYQSRMTSTSHP